MNYLEALKKTIDKQILPPVKTEQINTILFKKDMCVYKYEAFKKEMEDCAKYYCYNSQCCRNKYIALKKECKKCIRYYCCDSQYCALMNGCTDCMRYFTGKNGIDKQCVQYYDCWANERYYDTITYAFIIRKYKMIKFFAMSGYFDKMFDDTTTYGNHIVSYLETHTNAITFELLKKYKTNKYPEFPKYNVGSYNEYVKLYLADFTLVELLYTKYNMKDGIGIFEAIRSGRLDVLRYGHLNGFPYDKQECLDFIKNTIESHKEETLTYYEWCNKVSYSGDYHGDAIVKKIEIEILAYVLHDM